jgi:hypothetical protein
VEPNYIPDSEVFVFSRVYTPRRVYTSEECTLLHVGECRGSLPPLRGLGVLAQGQTKGSTLQQCTKKTLTTDPFDNTCEADEVSPEVEEGGVVGLKCL